MKQRSPAAVFFLSLITFGIYSIVWQVKTKGELNRLGASIPTAWLLIVPLANLYWVWKYAEGVEQVSGGRISAVLTLILLLLLSIVGMAILQSEFNKLGLQPGAGAGSGVGVGTPPTNPMPPVSPTPAGPTVGGPVDSTSSPTPPGGTGPNPPASRI